MVENQNPDKVLGQNSVGLGTQLGSLGLIAFHELTSQGPTVPNGQKVVRSVAAGSCVAL
jgi:hypothetical protein